MDEHTYIVIWQMADGQQTTETITARNHRAVERIIKKKGGTVVFLDRDEVRAPKFRTLKYTLLVLILFIVIFVSAIILRRFIMR